MEIQLKNQKVEVVKCDKCGKDMVNVDAKQLAPGDLSILKKAGVSISNPETTDNVCVNCEYKPTLGHRLANFFGTNNDDEGDENESDDNDDDSSFFGGFGGESEESSGGGFGGFGGFGGGMSAGGGASGSF